MNPDALEINELQDSVRDRIHIIIQMGYSIVEKESWLVN